MKHFFFPYNEESCKDGILKFLLEKCKESDLADDEILKAYYDMADIIHDKRFEKEDEELKTFLGENARKVDPYSASDADNSMQGGQFRIRVLETMWNYIEQQYEMFDTDNSKVVYKAPLTDEQQEEQYNISLKRTLYHLVRGNLCLRISQCYYEDFNLGGSDIWTNRAIEILWHGKNLAAALRDSVASQKRGTQADLYLRLIKLNLAKYYRDYARQNHRSDFDAALDEFKQVRCRVEEEYEGITDREQKRQYALIWMDAIINIVKIHRRKYQANIAEGEMLFFYSCMKEWLSEDVGATRRAGYSFLGLVEKADKAMAAGCKGRALYTASENNYLISEQAENDLPGLCRESFKKCADLGDYDRRRCFLLILLELARIRRDLHFEENYLSAMAIAITADQWSCEMDKRNRYTPGNNIDALITISSSLRKYIKFQRPVNCEKELLKEISVTLGNTNYRLELRFELQNEGENIAANLSNFMKKLDESAKNGHLKSKAEVIKWHCLYRQEPELLCSVKEQIGKYDSVSPYFDTETSNIQLQFLKGLALMRSGKYADAIKVFEALLSRNKKETQYIRLGTIGLKARYLLANCYMSLAEFSKAEKILKYLHDTLSFAYKSRKTQGVSGSTDADTDARIEIDLGYCYMQRGAYEDAIELYKAMYDKCDNNDKLSGNVPQFGLMQVKQQRRIMGLNNYAACCIFSINVWTDKISEEDEKKVINEKIETARKIFFYMDDFFSKEENKRDFAWYESNPETNLLKGYYTLCTGIVPGAEPITEKQIDVCRNISEPRNLHVRNQSILLAHPYFRKACGYDEAFAARYNLLNQNGMGNKAKYRNEVERISVYIINLTKIYKLYLANRERIEEVKREQESAGKPECEKIKLNSMLTVSNRELEYLAMSRCNLERFLLNFPANYKISLKAAIALAEWLLEEEKCNGKNSSETGGFDNTQSLQNQMFRSFSYITIYEERGARVFNILRNNSKFRFFTAAQRGKFCTLLLAMYKPIKAIKEECCFNLKDRKATPSLVHYTSLETLKKILSEETPNGILTAGNEDNLNEKCLAQREYEEAHSISKDKEPHFRINNCGYMNDVFEGNTFLKSIALIAGDIQTMGSSEHSPFVEKYFPQLNRSHEDMLPSGSNVYIGSLSVKKDSFPMWSVYAENESGCNIEFGEGFFDINGIPYCPRALRDYMLSKYTDRDYPLYIVQYIGSKFEEVYNEEYEKNAQLQEVDFEIMDTKGYQQSCGTEAIRYRDLYRLLAQIDKRWKELDDYLESISLENVVSDSKAVIRAFAADRINEIRFLFKNADYEYEGEVRVVYTDSTDNSAARTDSALKVPRVYVNMDRELENLTIRLGSRIEDATVDRYVTWLKHTKRVQKVGLAKQNRYTT